MLSIVSLSTVDLLLLTNLDLRIRPVQFTASIYTVLERGKPAKLALAKFTQERGAASSFHRVLGTIESVLKENDLMLDDPVKRKSITKMMKHAGL